VHEHTCWMLLLLQSANYLDVKPLLDLLTTHVAHLIVEARTPEGIRKRFNIKNDLTPEDLKKVCAVCYCFCDSDFVSVKQDITHTHTHTTV